jgi:hypothetical protein
VSESTLRARTTSEIVDAVFVLYRRDAGPYLVLSSLALIPTLIYQLVASTPTPESILKFDRSLWLLFIAPTISWLLGSSLLTVAGSDAYLGQEVDAAAVVRRIVPRLIPVLVAGLSLYLLCVFGMLFLFVPGFYLFTRYFAVVPVIVIEGVGVGTAYRRAAELSRDRKWHVLTTMALGYFMLLVATFGGAMLARLLPGIAIQLTVTSLISVLVRPILYLTIVVLYYDLRIRGEGFDLDHLAATLDAALPPAPSPSV